MPTARGELNATSAGGRSRACSPLPFLFVFVIGICRLIRLLVTRRFLALRQGDRAAVVGDVQIALTRRDPYRPIHIRHVEFSPRTESRERHARRPRSVATPFDVATATPPCSTFSEEPSNLTSESPRTVMLEPGALMFAPESERVCTRSPVKTAEDAGRGRRSPKPLRVHKAWPRQNRRQIMKRETRTAARNSPFCGKQTCPSHAPLLTILVTVNASYPPKFLAVNAFCACKFT